jgi:hypothetical protein
MVYSKVSVYCWRTKVGTTDEGKKWHKKFCIVSEGQFIYPPTTIVGQVESERSVSVLGMYSQLPALPIEISVGFML